MVGGAGARPGADTARGDPGGLQRGRSAVAGRLHQQGSWPRCCARCTQRHHLAVTTHVPPAENWGTRNEATEGPRSGGRTLAGAWAVRPGTVAALPVSHRAPEHDAVHADGPLPVLQRGLAGQVHELLRADDVLVVLQEAQRARGGQDAAATASVPTRPLSEPTPEGAPDRVGQPRGAAGSLPTRHLGTGFRWQQRGAGEGAEQAAVPPGTHPGPGRRRGPRH